MQKNQKYISNEDNNQNPSKTKLNTKQIKQIKPNHYVCVRFKGHLFIFHCRQSLKSEHRGMPQTHTFLPPSTSVMLLTVFQRVRTKYKVVHHTCLLGFTPIFQLLFKDGMNLMLQRINISVAVNFYRQYPVLQNLLVSVLMLNACIMSPCILKSTFAKTQTQTCKLYANLY